MQPYMLEHEAQQSITETALRSRNEQLSACGFQELPILDARGAHLFARATTKAPINVAFESRRVACKPAFTDSTHQVKTAARPVVFVTSDYVGRTGLKTQPAVNTCEQLLFFMRESRCELR